jgi:hypothetical protein
LFGLNRRSGSPSAHATANGRLSSLIEKEHGISFSRVHVKQLIIELGFTDCLKQVQLHVGGPSTQISTAILTSRVDAAFSRAPKAQAIDADN